MTKPVLSLELIVQSLAGFLADSFPEATVYSNPDRQNLKLPAWFINLMPGSSVAKQTGNRYKRIVCVDLVYVEDSNSSDIYDKYLSVAEKLDETLGLLKYQYNCNSYLLHTLGRQWRIDHLELHYEFRLEILASLTQPETPSMQKLEECNKKIK